MKKKIIKIGNSAGIMLPKNILEQSGIKMGEELIIEVIPSRNAILVRKDAKENKDISSLTLEFFVWLNDFNKEHLDVLKKLANK